MARHSKNRSAKYRKQADNTNKIATMVRHSKNRSASLVTNEEKKQTIDTTIPTLDTGARRVLQNYLELPRKRTRNDQHTIMPKEKLSGSEMRSNSPR